MATLDQDDVRREDIAECYRICRNFQDYGARVVLKKLRDIFSDKTEAELLELVIEVEKITAESSKPYGC